MIDDPKLKHALALISEAVADAYQRGKADAISAMIAAASGAMQQGEGQNASAPSLPIPPTPPRDDDSWKCARAPRGSAERVIRRAFATVVLGGVTVHDILAVREGDLEMMLADSSIRGELRRGEKAGKYAEIGGRWSARPE
jgi:hypothetical protein